MLHNTFTRLFRQFLKLKVLGRKNLLSKLSNDAILKFSSEEIVHFEAPDVMFQELPDALKNHVGQHCIEQPFVCTISNAELVGRNAVGLSRQSILMETVVGRWYVLERSEPFKLLLSRFLKVELVVDMACSLVNDWSRNYFHWVTECLTRLEGLEAYQQQIGGSKPILIINKNPAPWQRESLMLMGYSPEDCLEWDFSKIRVNNFVIPSVRRYQEQSRSGEIFTDIMSPSACQWLKQKLFQKLGIDKNSSNPQKRIFISRERAPSRKILNESEIMALLSSLGFDSYVLEEMTFSEQVRLFSQAEIIVAPHGAGLTNIIFCQNSSIIELFGHPLYIRPDYFQLSRCVGLTYTFIMCNYKDFDIEVDTQKLKDVILKITSSDSEKQILNKLDSN